MTTLADLRAGSRDDLEERFRTAPVGPRPRGRFRGDFLTRVDSRLARSRQGAAIVTAYRRAPWGIDFATDTWFFFSPRLRLGHFRVEPARSRWRETDVLALHYDVSRLPRPIRGRLYDELKPLDETLCLGLGGINAPAGDGDLFWFALHAAPD